jgi:ComF family protein
MNVIDSLLSIIAPHQCLGCSAQGSLVCGDCSLDLKLAPPLGMHYEGLEQVQVAVLYEGLAKDLVWRLKFGGAQAAVRPMVELLLRAMPTTSVLIVPVPTATSRVRRRGYDQATLLARSLAQRSGQQYVPCLRRLGQAHQVGAGRQQRRAQLADAFTVARPARVRGQHILLIDDVVTTGATFEAAAQALRAAGAASVSALAFARPSTGGSSSPRVEASGAK